jgi:hypothetical protein
MISAILIMSQVIKSLQYHIDKCIKSEFILTRMEEEEINTNNIQ